MQPIGAFFLFLFLPIVISLIALTKKHRASVTSLCSLLYVVLLNLDKPKGLLAVLLVLLLVRLATLKKIAARARALSLLLGALCPLTLLIVAKATPWGRADFPYGLTVIVLLSIATTVDTLRGTYTPPKHPLVFAGTLCFFPLLIAGPLVRGGDMVKYFKKQNPSTKNLYDGLRLYIIGCIYIFILAAPLYFIFERITATFGTAPDILLVTACPLLATLLFMFFIKGAQHIARGLALMCGITIPSDSKNPYRANSAAGFFAAWHPSLAAYVSDYITTPISTVLSRHVRWGKLLSTLVTVCFLTAVLSPRDAVMPVALAILPLLCLQSIPAQPQKAWYKALFCAVGTLILIVTIGFSFTLPALSLPAIIPAWRTPADTLTLFLTSAFTKNLYYLYASILCLSPLIVTASLRQVFILHVRHGIIRYRRLEMLVLLLLFFLILLYFTPRFPALATKLLADLLL